MYNSFELFFSGASSGAVVAVGVPDFFFACAWLETVVLKKHHCESRVDCKKCDKKTTAGLIVRRQAKRLCKPRGTTGEDFCLPGIDPAELPVMNYKAKLNRFQ
ncbi:MAG: hypothetical protein PHR83_17595 [Paludibacter sp.]|nr:hypothetical protein [Paludibacter sp.]